MKELDLTKLFKLFISHLLPILLAGVIFAAAAFSYCTYVADPVYRTDASILVNNGGLSDSYQSTTGIISGSNISASLYLITTCVNVLNENEIYKELAEKLDGKYTYTQLQRLFTVAERDDNSLLIDVSVQGSDAKEIKNITNQFLEIVPAYIGETIKYTDIKIIGKADKVYKVGPRTLYFTVAAFIVGVALCYLAYFIVFLLRNTVENDMDFKARYDVPLLGTVPHFDNKFPGGKRRGK